MKMFINSLYLLKASCVHKLICIGSKYVKAASATGKVFPKAISSRMKGILKGALETVYR
jgi:hypothetical protein